MSKTATPKKLSELRECTCCHGYTQSGYELRDDSSSRFVCDECYGRLSREYPLCGAMIEIKREVLSRIAGTERRTGFQAGYLMGKRTEEGGVQRITVTDCINSLKEGQGTVAFFKPDDVMRIRRLSIEKDCSVVAIFRTNPSGAAEFNSLDSSILSGMVNVLPYVIIAGSSEIQIAARDKNYPGYEYGVTVI